MTGLESRVASLGVEVARLTRERDSALRSWGEERDSGDAVRLDAGRRAEEAKALGEEARQLRERMGNRNDFFDTSRSVRRL